MRNTMDDKQIFNAVKEALESGTLDKTIAKLMQELIKDQRLSA